MRNHFAAANCLPGANWEIFKSRLRSFFFSFFSITFTGVFLIMGCTSKNIAPSKANLSGGTSEEFALVVRALERSARVSETGVITRYFAPTGVIIEPSEVEARISARQNLCRSLENKNSLFNKNGDGSQIYRVSTTSQNGICKVKLLPQEATIDVLKTTTLSFSDDLTSIALKVIQDERLGIDDVSVYVNGHGDLVEVLFSQDNPLNILHGNVGEDGKRLSISFVYNFSLAQGV